MKNLYCIFLFCLFFANGQEVENDRLGNLSFKNYATKQGLSQRSVANILQDKKGYLWFGTRYGLNKFDGHTFKNYYYSATNKSSLSDSWITALVEDDVGNLWIGTKNGLNRYNPIHDNFERVMIDSIDQSYLSGEIWDIKVDGPSHLWIATSKGLWYFDTELGTLTKYVHQENMPSGISSNITLSLLKTQDEKLWICTETSIDIYDPKTNVFSHYKYPKDLCPARVENTTVTLFEDSKKTIWLGYDDGLAVFDTIKNTFVEYRMLDGSKAITSSVRAIYEEKYLWVGTYQGLFLLDRENDKLYNYKHDVSIPSSLSQNSIYEIVADSRGDLWVGTWAGGINYLDRSPTIFKSFSAGPDKDNLNYKVVSSIVEDRKENLWVATEGGGLNFYDKGKKTFTHYTHDPNNANSLSGNNVKAIINDYQGNLWVGTHNQGLNYVSLEGENPIFKRIGLAKEGSRGLSSNKITALAQDKQGNIWIGTNNGGLNMYNTVNEKIIHIPDHQNILGSFIYTIVKSFGNNILVGSEHGLAHIDIINKKITKIPYKKDDQLTYGVQKIISIYAESETRLWIGTEGDGLFHYNFKTQASKRFGVREGLPDEVIYSILPDGMQNLWLSTNNGLSRFNPKSKEFRNFSLSDGLQGNEFNYGAYLKTSKGELVFGGVNGFTIFDPENIKEDTFAPPIVIQSIRIRNKRTANIADELTEVKLTYDQNDIAFDYVALGYSQPNKNKYAYKLEGFDQDWNYVGISKTATYTNLYHGEYEFKVKATNHDGIWTENATSFKIKILPPLWKSWWAYLSYIFLATGLFLIIRKYSIQRIQERAELKQERRDREQMEEVNRLKLQLFTNISHDFRTPLTLIIGPLKQMIDEKMDSDTIQKRLTGMYRNASILLQLINQLLDFRKSDAGKLKLSANKLNIIPFLKNIKLSFEELAKEKNIDYKFVADDSGIDVWVDKIEMKKVVLNVLSNAFKFTPKGGKIKILVSTKKKGVKGTESLKLVIIDNGKGIREEDLPFIFDRYFQFGQQNELRLGTGVGLTLAKDIVELHKGKIHVKSKEGRGTQFTIIVPLGNEHLEPHEITSLEDETDETTLLNADGPTIGKIGWINNADQKAEIDEQEVLVNTDLNSLLLVEDNYEVRNFIKSLFEKDYNVFVAANGIQGMKVAKQNPVDLIISDVMMPEMDGLEFCEKIKSDIRTSHIPVILLTARSSTIIKKTGYNTGADVYITKPFDSGLLQLQVANLLKSRQNLIEKFRKDIILEPKMIDIESPDEVFLNKAIGIIEENISNSEFMASTLSRKMNMSQSVLYRKFKVLTDQSISEFIRMVKLKRAAQLLSQTDLKIASIAYDVGFNDLKYFRTCFKKIFGITASQYRKSPPQKVEESN